MEMTQTSRGFELGEFKDLDGNECSIQDSSLATAAAIWLGVNDAQPQCSDKDSSKEQQDFIEWHKQYKEDENSVLTHTRVHLNEGLAAKLAKGFRKFCKKGSVKQKTFEDYYGLEFSVESHEGILLVGPVDCQPQILRPGEGWQPYEYPEYTVWTTKMKLDQKIAQDVLNVLVRFIATGTIKP